jgi:hypothetical protein
MTFFSKCESLVATFLDVQNHVIAVKYLRHDCGYNFLVLLHSTAYAESSHIR